MTLFEPLNFENLFINVFSGTIQIFVFVVLIVLSSLAARFRMPSSVFAISLILFAVMFGDMLGAIYILSVIIVCILTFGLIARWFK